MEYIESLDCLEQRLVMMISQNQFLTDVLMQLNAFEPLAFLSAGVIRNWVWSHLHGEIYDFNQTEIDVIFYDTEENNLQRTLKLKSLLEAKYPDQIWDITNQAHVHH